MLIEFTFGNFRSFRDPTTLSLVAANITSQNKAVDENNLIQIDKKLSLLTSAAIYGANASGKSKLISAINFMRNLVLNSSRESLAEEPIHFEPFRLNSVTEGQPGHFEVEFIQSQIKYRYGFEVTKERVTQEWLYRTPTIREAELFVRQGDEIQYNQRSFGEGRGLEKKTRSNALFLSVVAQFNGPIALEVQNWFRKMRFVSGLDDTGYQDFTVKSFLEDEKSREEIKRFVCALDLFIDDIQIQKLEPSEIELPKNMPDEIKSMLLKTPGDFISIGTYHKKFDANGRPSGIEQFSLEDQESEGTKKLFYLTGPILDSLRKGRVLLVDELEARMHPKITRALVQLFNSLTTNPKRAQLIFTTQDTNILDRDLLRRDQIWFAEKDHTGASHLYSMVEFKPRNDASFEKDYLNGRYGAIPYLGDLQRVMENASDYQVGETNHEA